jgi:hypothetical protein
LPLKRLRLLLSEVNAEGCENSAIEVEYSGFIGVSIAWEIWKKKAGAEKHLRHCCRLREDEYQSAQVMF